MIDIKYAKDCCGCSACIDVCPQKCIEQIVDKDGFIRPRVNVNDCIDCHLCENVCPEKHTVKKKYTDRRLYSAFHKNEDTRRKGSSGAIFAALAEYVIAKEGCVFGAAFDENLTLKHKKAEKLEELTPLMRSKYLQSNTLGIFTQVKEELKKDRLVVFVGTPCQVNAVYNFISTSLRKKLILVDFICHGVPSQSFFDKSIKYYQKRNDLVIKNVEFHTKYRGNYHSFRLTCIKNNGDKVIRQGTYTEFPFYRAFKKYIILRDSCYHCKHTGEDRTSDITIGDFWGINRIANISQDEFSKGYSEVIINSDKGFRLFSEIKDVLQINEFAIENAGCSNPSYLRCIKEGYSKKVFRIFNRYLPYYITEKILLK